MKNLRLMAVASLVSALGLPMSVALAQTPAPTPSKTEAQERVYGSQLMTVQERNEYRQRMRELKTQTERMQFRTEHHARMQERAKERGLTLPDAPPAQGQGAGPRDGSRPGMAPGAGPRGPGGGIGRP
jgi:hypothetical protein